MEYGILKQSAVTIYENANTWKESGGERVSSIADEGLYGMAVRIMGEEVNGYLPVETHYGYRGYVERLAVLPVSLQELKDWDRDCIRAVDASCADVLSVPKVRGIRLASLLRGSLIEMLPERENDGWSAVRLVDGARGYIRTQFLMEKKFKQSFLWEGILPQVHIGDEAEFRRNLVRTAVKYMGVQYRFGGKSSMGLDCSGLTSMTYMLNGILIYRDAVIKEGYPVKEIPFVKRRPGDLLYFPGHIAMYMGNGRYIHSTGRAGSGGVVVNSLNPEDLDYREDLAAGLLGAGSIF
ncbi:NlpC/P60 family protein [Clostridium sp. MCC353]|nr:NlpC/P60 family protein [Clostridium sp. MCC353]